MGNRVRNLHESESKNPPKRVSGRSREKEDAQKWRGGSLDWNSGTQMHPICSPIRKSPSLPHTSDPVHSPETACCWVILTTAITQVRGFPGRKVKNFKPCRTSDQAPRVWVPNQEPHPETTDHPPPSAGPVSPHPSQSQRWRGAPRRIPPGKTALGDKKSELRETMTKIPIESQFIKHKAFWTSTSQKFLWKTDFKDKEMGREVGEGFRMGDTCTPMADSCQCMVKTTTIL